MEKTENKQLTVLALYFLEKLDKDLKKNKKEVKK